MMELANRNGEGPQLVQWPQTADLLINSVEAKFASLNMGSIWSGLIKAIILLMIFLPESVTDYDNVCRDVGSAILQLLHRTRQHSSIKRHSPNKVKF
jgi:hypothetical protein